MSLQGIEGSLKFRDCSQVIKFGRKEKKRGGRIYSVIQRSWWYNHQPLAGQE